MDESSDMEQDRENDKQSINNGDTESAFECRRIRCSKTFHDEESLSVHEKKCRGGKLVKEPKVYLCPKSFCKNKKKDFKTSFNLNRHMKVCIEKGKKSFVCKKCQKEFAKKYKLDRHIPTHEKKSPLYAELVGRGFLVGTFIKLMCFSALQAPLQAQLVFSVIHVHNGKPV